MAPGPDGFAVGAVRAPHPALRPYVAAMVGYHDVLPPNAVHHGIASASATVILAFDEPIDTGWLATPADHGTYWSLLAGLHPAPALIRTHGFQHGIQLGLTPLGVKVLLGIPAAEVAGEMAELCDVPGALPDQLHERLATAPDWHTRFGLLEAHLLTALADSNRRLPSPEVIEAWRLLAASHGALRIHDVAARVDWSRRRLARAFAAEYGVTPKLAARLLRLDRARELARDGVPLADAAALTGYSDQAHLSREWRVMAGASPRESLTHPYIDDPFLQDTG